MRSPFLPCLMIAIPILAWSACSGGDHAASSGATGAGDGPEPCPHTCSGAGCCLADQRFGPAQASLAETIVGNGIAADGKTGDVLVAGAYQGGGEDIGAGALPPTGGIEALFVARYDREGHARWSRGFTSATFAGNVGTTWAGFAGSDVVMIATGMDSSIDLGCGAMDGYAVAAKLSGADGSCLWSQSLGSSADGTAATVDAAGDVLVAGLANVYADTPSVYFPCSPQVPPGASSFGWVSKLSGADGSCQWTHLFEGSAWGVATDAAANVYVAGSLQGSLSFAGTTLTAVGSGDALLLKYDGAGNPLWSQSWGSPSSLQYANGVAVGTDGRVWVAGTFSGSIALGSQTFGPTPGTLVSDVFVAGITPAGALTVATAFTSTGNDGVSTDPVVALDAQGALLVGGSYVGDLTIGSTALTAPTPKSVDMFLTKLDPATLAPTWVRHFGDGRSYLSGLAVDDCKDVLLTGGFTGTIDFGCGPGPAGGGGLFVTRLGP